MPSFVKIGRRYVNSEVRLIKSTTPLMQQINIIKVHEFLIRVKKIMYFSISLSRFVNCVCLCDWYYYADMQCKEFSIYVSTKLKLLSASCGDLQMNKNVSHTFKTGCRNSTFTEQHVNIVSLL
jgi:hypothetical protein